MTRLWVGQPRDYGSIPGRARDISHLYNTRACSGTHPASYLGVQWALVFEVKQLGFVAGY